MKFIEKMTNNGSTKKSRVSESQQSGTPTTVNPINMGLDTNGGPVMDLPPIGLSAALPGDCHMNEPSGTEQKTASVPLLPPVTPPESFASISPIETMIRSAAQNSTCVDPPASSTQEIPSLPPVTSPARPLEPSQASNVHTTSSAPTNSSRGSCPGDEKAHGRPASQKAEEMDNATAEFTKTKKGAYNPLLESKLRNNLKASVGYLELANATDFAANVWNAIPVPIYAAILMGLGGSLAIILSLFAVRDGYLSLWNIKALRKERMGLLTRRAKEVEEGLRRPACDSASNAMRLEVNKRELGTEIIDRLSMDVFMGFGALIVGIGTLMAIGGAEPPVYKASNLLSGYIGNSPSLLWGVFNTLWSAYIFIRAHSHLKHGLRELESGVVKQILTSRVRTIKVHSFVMGLSTMVSGAGGMVSVTRWWGYVMILPCIIASVYGNVLWRKRIGYERPLSNKMERQWDREELVQELEWILSVKQTLDTHREVHLSDLVANPGSPAVATEFIVRCDLFEDFSCRLLRDKSFAAYFDTITNGPLTGFSLTPQMVLAASPELSPLLLTTAEICVQKRLRWQIESKERYLLEMLGARLCCNDDGLEGAKTKEEVEGHEMRETDSSKG